MSCDKSDSNWVLFYECVDCTNEWIAGNGIPICPKCGSKDYLSRFVEKGKKPAADASAYQVGGDHYTKLAVQPWEAMQAWMTPEEFAGFLKGNAIKYLARDKRDSLEDLKKARHYLDKLIQFAEESEAE